MLEKRRPLFYGCFSRRNAVLATIFIFATYANVVLHHAIVEYSVKKISLENDPNGAVDKLVKP